MERDFQVLFGMSEVNSFILWNKVKPGQEGTTLTHFRMQLCHQMLTYKWIMAEREAASATWVIQAEADVEHELVSCDRGRCRMCVRITQWRCAWWPNPLVNLGSPEGRKLLHCTCALLQSAGV